MKFLRNNPFFLFKIAVAILVTGIILAPDQSVKYSPYFWGFTTFMLAGFANLIYQNREL